MSPATVASSSADALPQLQSPLKGMHQPGETLLRTTAYKEYCVSRQPIVDTPSSFYKLFIVHGAKHAIVPKTSGFKNATRESTLFSVTRIVTHVFHKVNQKRNSRNFSLFAVANHLSPHFSLRLKFLGKTRGNL
jgi:hypothetical protein